MTDALPHLPWLPTPPAQDGGDALSRAVDALRVLQATMTAAAPDDASVWDEAAARLTALADLLAPHAVGEDRQVVGHRHDLPGRGQAMSPPVLVDEWDETHVLGRVTYSRFYLGGNGAVHGGALPLVFDEVLGRLANTGRARARTAFLHVDFRSIAPVGVELVVRADVDREEGRKRFLSGTLHHEGTLVAEATGLFVALRDGQP